MRTLGRSVRSSPGRFGPHTGALVIDEDQAARVLVRVAGAHRPRRLRLRRTQRVAPRPPRPRAARLQRLVPGTGGSPSVAPGGLCRCSGRAHRCCAPGDPTRRAVDGAAAGLRIVGGRVDVIEVSALTTKQYVDPPALPHAPSQSLAAIADAQDDREGTQRSHKASSSAGTRRSGTEKKQALRKQRRRLQDAGRRCFGESYRRTVTRGSSASGVERSEVVQVAPVALKSGSALSRRVTPAM